VALPKRGQLSTHSTTKPSRSVDGDYSFLPDDAVIIDE
jgi:hypothetical protein